MPVATVTVIIHRVLFAFRLSESSIALGTQMEFNICSEKQDRNKHTETYTEKHRTESYSQVKRTERETERQRRQRHEGEKEEGGQRHSLTCQSTPDQASFSLEFPFINYGPNMCFLTGFS